MTKRGRDSQDQQPTKKQKVDPCKKRPNAPVDSPRVSKRTKVYEYWHMAPLTRVERAAQMAAIYERLCCRA